MDMLLKKEEEIISFIEKNNKCSSKEIFDGMKFQESYPTLKRILTKLISKNYIATKGQGKATKYVISSRYKLLKPIDINEYFKNDIDERKIKENFNFSINETLSQTSIFTKDELEKLKEIDKNFRENKKHLSENQYKKEFERLAIDLSWKSSQIEGNTYSLLETERLLKEKESATGKSNQEAIMLLNHKEALDFILDNPNYLNPLSISKIEDIHKLLTKDLEIEKNIRSSRVGISGTNYKPLENEFKIKEALEDSCKLINHKKNIYEKALLALLLISYIQPFYDGNKRTSRIVSNAILMSANFCPLSFRTVNSIDYKKAILLFYEQNNISAFKNIFIEQAQFAVDTYF